MKKLRMGLGLAAIVGALGLGFGMGVRHHAAPAMMAATAAEAEDCRPVLTTCTFAHDCCSNMCVLSPILGVGVCL